MTAERYVGTSLERICAELEVEDLNTAREWCGKCRGSMQWMPSLHQRLIVVNRCTRCGNVLSVRQLIELGPYYNEPTFALK